MVDIFDEVEEELRAERAQKLLKKYGGYMVAAALLVVGAVAGWQMWRWHEARVDAAAATQYIAAMSLADATVAGSGAANRTAAIGAFDTVVANAPDGYRAIARLRAAALQADAGDLLDALKLWDQIAADTSLDPLLRDLASLMWAEHQIDTGDPSLLETRLKALATPDNPWHQLAEEQLALLDMRLGKTDAARTTLHQLAQDTTAPDGLRARVATLLNRLGG